MKYISEKLYFCGIDICDAIVLGNRTGSYWFKQVGKARVFCDMDTTVKLVQDGC